MLVRRFLLTVAIAVFTCVIGAAPSAAALIVVDDFESYAVGNLSGQNGGTGWTGPYAAHASMKVVSGGLSYTNGAISIDGGGQSASLQYSGGNGDNFLSRPFAEQSGTLYFSFLLCRVAGSDNDTNDFLQFILNDDTSHNNSASIGFRNSAGNPFFARLRAAATSDPTTNAPGNSTEGTTFFLVGKASKVAGSETYNRVDLFVNPSSLTEPGSSSAFVGSYDTLAGAFDYFTLRTATLDNGDRIDFDAFRIGTTWADVVEPLSSTAIPEPSSLALVGGVLIVPAWRRWRRRATLSSPATAA